MPKGNLTVLWSAPDNVRIAVMTDNRQWFAQILAGIDYEHIVTVGHTRGNGAFVVRGEGDPLIHMKEFQKKLWPALNRVYKKMRWPKDPASTKALGNLMALCNECHEVYTALIRMKLRQERVKENGFALQETEEEEIMSTIFKKKIRQPGIIQETSKKESTEIIRNKNGEFEKWFNDLLQEELGFNEFDAGEITTKVSKKVLEDKLKTLKKFTEAAIANGALTEAPGPLS